ncbi:hypothetical protein J3R82DRAFT_4559 [Butyriboletus roseoflavus]|nr:hypothetical protein J3R82DRAFT_4559 [Butyriboletus roseoflavus]
MSERYVPPPPPYELSIQRDQKVVEEVQALEVSKESPLRDEECKDSKHSRALADETSRDITTHTFPSIPKRPTRSDSASLQAPRPLPSNFADIDTRPLPRGRKLGSAVDTKTHAVQNDHEEKAHSPAPLPFPAIGPPLGNLSYMQSMLYPSTSVHSSPSHYPSQPSYDTPRLRYDNRRPVSAYSPTEHHTETSFKCSSHAPSQSPLPQNVKFGTRMSFDPSVAYSNPQAGARTTFSAQRGAASLYRRVSSLQRVGPFTNGHV